MDKPLDRAKIEKMISGSLKDCIHQHGPITRNNIGSASKRIFFQLKAEGYLKNNQEK